MLSGTFRDPQEPSGDQEEECQRPMKYLAPQSSRGPYERKQPHFLECYVGALTKSNTDKIADTNTNTNTNTNTYSDQLLGALHSVLPRAQPEDGKIKQIERTAQMCNCL